MVHVIELSGVQFDLKSYVWFQNWTSASLIWNHKSDFGPKLHDTKFNYHFITAILKSQSIIVNINILFLSLHFHLMG